jgi:Methyltransferase domain
VDPRILASIEQALGDARTVLDVGGGLDVRAGLDVRRGLDEVRERRIVTIFPSFASEYPYGSVADNPVPHGSAPDNPVPHGSAVHGSPLRVCAESEMLPFSSGSFDAAVAVLSVHRWRSPRIGLREVARVARRVVVLHLDPLVHARFWLFSDYLPERGPGQLSGRRAAENARTISANDLSREMGATRVEVVPVPADCVGDFWWAYWRRPERLLERETSELETRDARSRRRVVPSELLGDAVVANGMDRLRADLADGSWRRRHGHLLALDSVDGGLRLVIRE